jgi:hypothetical protein
LKRLGGRAQVGDGFRLAEAGGELAFAVNGGDVPAVARLDDRPAPDFDERRGLRNIPSLFSTHRRIVLNFGAAVQKTAAPVVQL